MLLPNPFQEGGAGLSSRLSRSPRLSWSIFRPRWRNEHLKRAGTFLIGADLMGAILRTCRAGQINGPGVSNDMADRTDIDYLAGQLAGW